MCTYIEKYSQDKNVNSRMPVVYVTVLKNAYTGQLIQ